MVQILYFFSTLGQIKNEDLQLACIPNFTLCIGWIKC